MSRSLDLDPADRCLTGPAVVVTCAGAPADRRDALAQVADVVVAGYRLHKTSTEERPLLGSMLLGLYDDDGELQHIGVSASFTATRRAELWHELQPLVCDIADHPWGRWNEFLTANPDRVPGTQSRWSAGKDLGFTALRP